MNADDPEAEPTEAEGAPEAADAPADTADTPAPETETPEAPGQPSKQEASDLEKLSKNLDNPKNQGIFVKKGVELLVPWAEAAREKKFVQEMQQALDAMSPEDRREFVTHCADTSIDTTWWEDFKNKVSLLLPPWFALRGYEYLKNGTYGALILTGAIGNSIDQKILNDRIKPGMLDKFLVPALKAIALYDSELVSKGLVTVATIVVGAKSVGVDVLKATQAEIRKRPKIEGKEEEKKPSGEVKAVTGKEHDAMDKATTPPGVLHEEPPTEEQKAA